MENPIMDLYLDAVVNLTSSWQHNTQISHVKREMLMNTILAISGTGGEGVGVAGSPGTTLAGGSRRGTFTGIHLPRQVKIPEKYIHNVNIDSSNP